jgi:hypothetical protein
MEHSSRLAEASTSERAIWRAEDSVSFEDRQPIIKQWLEECKLHPECSESHVENWPTRLIDVGWAGYQTNPRLVYTDRLRKSGLSYVTLSHCWGSKASLPLRTTKATVQSHLAGIPFKDLPATFQDACTITRGLGIRYIWIDSLCIIQDDEKDWQKEAAQMAAIYQGSCMTIAATDSPNSRVGCFLAGAKPPLQIKYDLDQPKALVRIGNNDFVTSVQLSALNKRGWALQELLLSRRTLHCARGQFYWQCRSQFKTEDDFYDTRDFVSLPKPSWKFEKISTAGSYHVWWHWVREYTRRSLTVKEDRLAAFAGITRLYQTETKQTPVLGLWKENIVTDLTWGVGTRANLGDQHAQSSHRTQDRISNVPSWTWLSRDVPVMKPLELATTSSNTPQIEILELEICWTGEPLTSGLASGTKFSLYGRIKPLEFRPWVGERSRHPSWLVGHDAHLRAWVIAGHHESDRNKCYFDDAHAMSDTDPVTKPALLLTHRQGFGELLILEPAGDGRRYRRIGVGQYQAAIPYEGPFAGVEPTLVSLV